MKNKKLEKYLKSERQWRREERIPHARLQLSHAATPEDQAFWKAVLEANGAEVTTP